MRTLIQVPEGLKRKALEIADKNDDAIISAEACYGGCDLRDREAELLGCKKIVHVGHTKFLEGRLPVDYVDHKTDVDAVRILADNIGCLKNYKNVGLVASLQFIDSVGAVKSALEKNGKRAFVGRGKNMMPGQILGCNVGAAKGVEKDVDCFLLIGSGKFHALGLALATEKPILILDVEKNNIGNVESLKQTMLKQKFVAMALAKDAQKIGILISTKPGQMNVELAEQMKKKVESAGKKAYLLSMDEITPAKLVGFGFDAYICTACPRIAIENRTAFGKPILNPDEF